VLVDEVYRGRLLGAHRQQAQTDHDAARACVPGAEQPGLLDIHAGRVHRVPAAGCRRATARPVRLLAKAYPTIRMLSFKVEGADR
jgi:hypothetical protein